MPAKQSEFVKLPRQDQREILQTAAAKLGRQAVVLEKDIWVCWALEALFSIPDPHPMAFKGGTSLSKVFGIIDRFSEDIDVTLDYRAFGEVPDPLEPGISRTSVKKISEQLKQKVPRYTRGVVQPFFIERIAALHDPTGFTTDLSENGEKLRLSYPSAIGDEAGYLGEGVLLEFGGRNVIDPNKEHEVVPDIENLGIKLAFPRARVAVLAPERTFWEKATLIHAECGRDRLQVNPNRLSRHWYDLVMLARHPMGESALERRELLQEVVDIKELFFRTGSTKYEECLAGRMRLVPSKDGLDALRRDYREMSNAGMLHEVNPGFDELVEELHLLEERINSSV